MWWLLWVQPLIDIPPILAMVCGIPCILDRIITALDSIILYLSKELQLPLRHPSVIKRHHIHIWKEQICCRVYRSNQPTVFQYSHIGRSPLVLQEASSRRGAANLYGPGCTLYLHSDHEHPAMTNQYSQKWLWQKHNKTIRDIFLTLYVD